MAHGVAEALLNAPQVGGRGGGLLCHPPTHHVWLAVCWASLSHHHRTLPLLVLLLLLLLVPPPPQVLGSLQLLFNPTGLVRSVRAGVGDLLSLPLEALQAQSLSQVRRAALRCVHACRWRRRRHWNASRLCCLWAALIRTDAVSTWATRCAVSPARDASFVLPLLLLLLQFIGGVGLGSVSLVKHTLGE